MFCPEVFQLEGEDLFVYKKNQIVYQDKFSITTEAVWK